MIEIIPAIDIIEGKCVRLSQGDYSQKKVYNEHPLEVAKQFQDNGITRLHMVDLDGAKSNRIINYKVLEQVAANTNLIIDFGGGLKSDQDLKIAFNSGAHMITGGSIAVKNPDVFTGWIQYYGADKIILGADVKDETIAVSGWQESTTIGLFEFLQEYTEKGITKTICTDISKDGMMQGPSTDLYVRMKQQLPQVYVIASGGVSRMQDIVDLHNAGIDAVITGKAIYEGAISLDEIARYIVG
ncbi:MAG: 1-(5-phosphoribosyl)-5-((5-phosphoribosylamino)methylideneamino) imidazole-4-carboxamide isomerase [Bacteroidetes bacterium ADurb.Bin217]|nr:MAG: 1-(5-phosphoribosyl)-5-((5-phosphoribosylamino)methylideneamino) imidazole-4-carboxamide isomerase [Bacteroidetes bacterium ADurb.Bin217]